LLISCEDIGRNNQWQGEIPAGFSRNYGTVGYDYGWSAAYSPFDEGIVITGQKSPVINGKSDLWAIKTDNRGLLIWERSFGGGENEEGNDVIATSDGGFLFVGYSWSFGDSQQIYAIKTDFYGNTQWERTYGGSMWDVGQAVIELKDGGYAIAGFTNSPNISSGNTDMLLIVVDKNGNKVWQKAFGNLAYPNHEWAYDIVETIDEGFILVGARDRYDKGSMNSLIIRIDKNGGLIWEKELLGEAQTFESIYSISKSNDGGYFLSSGVNSSSLPEVFQPKVIKIDASGNIDWQRTFNSNSQKNHQFRATSTEAGNLILVGTSSRMTSLGFKEDAFMIKIDASGNIIWSHPYGTLDHDDWGWSVFQTPKENIIFVGSTKSFNASLFDIYLVGTNSQGILQ
jgi:hypothetical protein